MQPSLTREVEVFENQRYILTKFSKEGLLPTDRRAYSCSDGSLSWKTLEEADAALLSTGWEFVNPWCQDLEHPNTDDEGWSYDVDFGTFQNASGVKGMTHFVRRRRYTRIQDYDVSRVKGIQAGRKIVVTCDHCDLSVIEKIQEALITKLAEVSLKVTKDVLHAATINPLKSQLISIVLDPPSMGMPTLYHKLDSFDLVEKSIFSRLTSSRDMPVTVLQQRAQDIKDNMLFDESGHIARAIIQKHDTDFEFHCSVSNCGSTCQFGDGFEISFI